MRHADLLDQFQGAIMGGPLPQGVTASIPGAVTQRFNVYRNNVHHSLGVALGARFPVVARIVGPEFFAAMAPVYLKTGLPDSPLLFQWGQTFPDFLTGFPPLVGLPWLADVARLELARGKAYHAADAEALPAAALGQAAQDAGRARLTLHPSVQLLASVWPVVTAWAMNQPGATPTPLPANRPEAALILHDRRDEVPVQEIGPGDLAFVAAVQRGETLLQAAAEGQAAEPGHTPAGILTTLARTGALVGLSMGDDACLHG